jgi:hypothetical protein
VMYKKGQGVPQNKKTAVKWYTLAAKPLLILQSGQRCVKNKMLTTYVDFKKIKESDGYV